MPIAREEADILVAGAGPAGASIARLLALRGRCVTLVDPGTPSVDRLEVAAPSGCGVFAALGIAPLLHDTEIAQPCLGIRRRWGGGRAEIEDFLRQPGGQGFILDRRRFDEALRAAARDAGVRFIKGRVVRARREADATEVTISMGNERLVISAAIAVDTTGRPAALARRLGAQRIVGSPLIAERQQIQESAETSSDGWLHVKGKGKRWGYQLTGPDRRSESWTIAAPNDLGRATARLRMDASAALLSRAAGEGWIAIGDAAAAFDPVTSQGLVNALSSAVVAAGAILSPGGLDAEARAVYADAIAATFRHSEAGRAAVYAALAAA